MLLTSDESLRKENMDFELLQTQIKSEFGRRMIFYNSGSIQPESNSAQLTVDNLEANPLGKDFLSYESMPLLLQKLYDNDPGSQALNSLEDYCIDDGLAKKFEVSILVDGQEVSYISDGIHVLSRNGLVSKALEGNEALAEAISRNLTIIKIDLSGFRDIDNVPLAGEVFNSDLEVRKILGDPLRSARSSETLADYVLSEVSTIAQAKVDSINFVLSSMGLPGELIWGRIGGDEFGIVFKDIHDEELIKQLFQIIITEEDGIESIQTYYLNPEQQQVVPGNVKVNSETTIINFGSDDKLVAARQFEKMSEQGNFFSSEQIKKEIENPNQEVKLPQKLDKLYERYFVRFNKKNTRLLEELKQESPELTPLLDAIVLNTNIEDPDKEFANFCIDYIYDRMSHAPVNNMRVFLSKVIKLTTEKDFFKDRYSHTTYFAFDLQGPKGINDLISYGVTDLAVLSTILSVLDVKNTPPNELSGLTKKDIDIQVGRSGTKLVVCVGTRSLQTKGINQAKQVLIQKLTSITGAKLIEGGIECEVPVAHARMDRRITTNESARIMIRHLIDQANDSFKMSQLLKLITLTGDAQDKSKIDAIKKLLQPNYEPPQPGMKLSEFLRDENFIPEYYRRVRVEERLRDLMKSCSVLIEKFTPSISFKRESVNANILRSRKKIAELREALFLLQNKPNPQ